MKLKRISLITLLLLVFIFGCQQNLETEEPISQPNTTDLYNTSVVEVTAAFGQTATIMAYEATGVSVALTAAYTPSQIPTLARTQIPQPSATSELPCNAAAPGVPMDVTIRDDTEMAPGESFTKTWRLQNAGSCKWNRLYSLVFFSGNSMSAFQSAYLPGEVFPGQMVDLSVDMVAPLSPGIYQSNWMLADADGNLFGLGPNGDAPFWARIQVIQAVTPTLIPTLTLTPTPIVYRDGIVSLAHNDGLDLDTGLTSQPEGLSDLIYQLNPPYHMFIPANAAGMILFGEQVPDYDDCKNTLVSSDPISFDSINTNIYVCYHTNMGKTGRFHIYDFDDLEDIIRIEFLTWSD